MDLTGLIVLGGILVYGVLEYRRREHLHKEAMEYLQHGLEPPSEPPVPASWRLVTTGAVGGLLLAVVIGLVVLSASLGHYGRPVLVIAAFFASLLVFVALMYFRDRRARKDSLLDREEP